jgi:hypothetical protein
LLRLCYLQTKIVIRRILTRWSKTKKLKWRKSNFKSLQRTKQRFNNSKSKLMTSFKKRKNW